MLAMLSMIIANTNGASAMNIYQAIETRRLGPTNHRGARIIATPEKRDSYVAHWTVKGADVRCAS
jgi:hypothetical protein